MSPAAPAPRWCVLVNDLDELRAVQTTWRLGVAATLRGVAVHYVALADLGLREDGRVVARARRLELAPGVSADLAHDPHDAARARFASASSTDLVLDDVDAVLIRTSPGRDPARAWLHASALVICRLLVDRGVLVVNDPDGLARAATKLWLYAVPERFRPRTLVSRDHATVRAFVRSCVGGAVLKPSAGTRGDDVFLVRQGSYDNLNQIIDVLTRAGFVMAQEFVPEAVDGDMRLILVDGRPLEVDGAYAAVRRVPSGDDFRSNVHVGARVAPGYPTERHLELARDVGARLSAIGVFIAGLDLIGDKVVEVNAYSAGGLTDADRFHDRDFTGAIVDAILARQAARPS